MSCVVYKTSGEIHITKTIQAVLETTRQDKRIIYLGNIRRWVWEELDQAGIPRDKIQLLTIVAIVDNYCQQGAHGLYKLSNASVPGGYVWLIYDREA